MIPMESDKTSSSPRYALTSVGTGSSSAFRAGTGGGDGAFSSSGVGDGGISAKKMNIVIACGLTPLFVSNNFT